MVFWLKQKFFLLMGVTLSLLIFFSYQNCTRVRFEAEKVDAASKAGVKDAHFECTPNQTQVCDIAGIVGTMSCETTDHGPAWGSCIIPPTTTTTTMPAVTTTTLPGATTTTTVTTTSTTTTTIRANNPCLLILNDVANPVALANGAAYTAYLEPLVPASGACQSQSRICMNGSVTGSYQYSSCVKDSGQCQLNGVTVNHNSSAVFFEANVVPFGQHCKSETRNCRDRILDGSYQFPGPCTVAPPANCDFGNNTVLHGNSVDVYPSATVPYGQSCVSQKRNCFNGNLDGIQSTITQCQPLPGKDCTVGNIVVPHGSSRQFAQALTVPFGNSCQFATRTCTDGTLSGPDYREISCQVDKAIDCNFDGQILPHGQSVTAYSSQSVAYNANCSSVSGTVACSNGVLQGASTYPFRTCQPAQPKTCDYFGQPIAHGATVDSYSSSTVPFLSTCASIKKTSRCEDGNFQPALSQFKTCNPLPETKCAFNGSLYSHGAVVQAARLMSVTEPATCDFENRTCDGVTGQFSGSYAYPTCVQQVDLSCRNYVYSGCTKKSGSSEAACGYAAPNYFHPEYVCSGNLISGQYEGPMGTGPTTGSNYESYASPGWATVNLPRNVPNAKCVVNQKLGYATSFASYSVLYYDGPPKATALTTGLTAYPNNQPLITKVKDCGF
jgi:hypothetical protein